VVSRDELNASQLDELAALDRILARESVDERHLELAALVDSVRAGAPQIDPAFEQRLNARLLAPRHSRAAALRSARPPLRRLLFASGGLVAAAVALTIVISSGVLGGSGHPSQTPGLALPGTAKTPGVANALAPAAAGQTHSTPAGTATGAAPASGAAAVAPRSSFAAVGTSGRLVHRYSTLTLASPTAAMQGVANQIVAATEHAGGVVESSNVNILGAGSNASFALQVPSTRLASLIATLSRLAGVRALTQNTQDITNPYDQAQARLADNVAERAALLKNLATVATIAQETSIQKQIDKLASRIAAEHREIDGLLEAGHNATLKVNVVPGAAAAKHSAGGLLTSAYHRALHALEEILAIALIALAIILPFALSALALWWGATAVRQRARERAMRTA
jgi:hypothetical protein